MEQTVQLELDGHRPVPGAGEVVVHTVCCVDERLTLCGLRFPVEPGDGGEAECVVCEDLAQSPSFCPRGERCATDRCPR